MNNVFVAAEGGCFGNFLSTAVKLFFDSNYIEKYVNNAISAAGSADGDSNAHFLYFEIEKRVGNPYQLTEQNSAMISAMIDILKSDSYYQSIPEYDREFVHVNTMHFIRPATIAQLLTVPDLKIIYVTFEEQDCDLIAKLKISKNFEKGYRIPPLYKQLLLYHKAEEKFINELESLNGQGENMSLTLRNKLEECWKKTMLLRLPNSISMKNFNNKNLLFIKFGEVLNDKNAIIDKLSKFLNMPGNDNLNAYYDKFVNVNKNLYLQ